MRAPVRLLLALVSLAAAAFLILRADVPAAWQRATSDIGAGGQLLLLLALVAPVALGYFFHTLAWSAGFGREGPGAGLGRLYFIRMAGEAINQVTPFLPLGGEPVKAWLYAAGGGAIEKGAISVLATRLVMTFAQVVLVFIAIGLAVVRPPARPALMWALAAFPLFVGVNLLIVPPALLWLGGRWRNRLANVPLIRRNAASLRAIRQTAEFWRSHPGWCGLVLCYSFLGWIAAAGEFWMVALAIGRPIDWPTAFMLEGLLTSITMATFFIPGNLGSQEAGILYLCGFFAAGPLAPAMTVIRRLREVIWIALGLAVLGCLGAGPRLLRAASGDQAVEPS